MSTNEIIEFGQPKDVIHPQWLATYGENMDLLWEQVVSLNSNLFVLDRIFAFRFDIFVLGRAHFWDVVVNGLIEGSILTIWRVAMDSNANGLSLPQQKNLVRSNLLNSTVQKKFDIAFDALRLKKTMASFEPRISALRHNYIAHFNLANNAKPTPEHLKQIALTFADLMEMRDTINSYFTFLCFGRQRAFLPVEYQLCKPCDVDEILDGVARESDVLNLAERRPSQWGHYKEIQSKENLDIVRDYRLKFGLPGG